MSHLFYMQHRVGDLVDVAPERRSGRPNSEGGRGYIVAKRSSSPSTVVDVEYIVPKKKLSKEVNPDRLSPATIETVARRRRPRSASDDVPIQPSVARPSLLSTHHQAHQKLMSTITPSPPKRAKSTSILVTLVTSAVLLDRSRIWNGDDGTKYPIFVYLQRNNHKDKGYLRRNDAKAAGADPSKLKSHLSSDEKNRILRIKAQLTGVVDFNQHGVTQLIAHAYGVGKRTIQDWEKKEDLNRKQRKDAGGNILTSSKLQDNWFSPLNCYKKSQRRSTIANTLLDTGADADDSNFKEQWNAMSPEEQAPYVLMSNEQKKRAPFLIGEIQRALQSTGGYCTWRQLETHLADSSDGIPIMSREVIRKTIMGLPDSTYVSTRLFPALTAAHIIKRKIWCQQFWVFWDLAKTLLPRKRILLVHMDEKWFYSIVVRTNNKLVPFLGMESVGQHSVHHKNYLGKLLCIATTVYLTDRNNITAGGRGIHGTVVRAGHMLPAKSTTYKRQTDANGKISYPKRDDNINRKEGQLYFEPAEITANTREVRGKRKFSLQHDYWPVIFRFLEALCRRLRAKSRGQEDYVVLYQWDGAGSHAKKELIAWLEGEFIQERGWIIRNQASQSPHLQVHDCSLFPSLSKYVSSLQCMGGSRVVDNDELWELVQEAYYRRLTPEVIARAFAHHVQIVNAIYNCNGGDSYHRTGGLHCGVRKAYAPKYRLNDAGEPIGDPIGVELIESPEETQQQLRYDRPMADALDDLDWKDLFNRSQLEFLVNNLPADSPEILLAEQALHGVDR